MIEVEKAATNPAGSIPFSFASQPLLGDAHCRQHRTGQFNALGTGPLGRKQLRESAFEVFELGAVMFAEAEEPAGIGADNRQQALLAVLDRLTGQHHDLAYCEFMMFEHPVQRGEELRAEPLFADLHSGLEPLGFLTRSLDDLLRPGAGLDRARKPRDESKRRFNSAPEPAPIRGPEINVIRTRSHVFTQ